MIILSFNCGSSSVKYQLYNWAKKEIIAKGIVERVTIGDSFCVHEVNHREKITLQHDCPTHKEAIKLIIETLIHPKHGAIKQLSDISAIGHRVVHGGEKFSKSVLINQEVLDTFKELAVLAPLHNPPNIMGIEAAMELLPDIPHAAIMDTAWHQTMLPYVYTYAVPYEWYEKYRIRRYGFHGTSLLYVAKRAAVLLQKDPFQCNIISCHIGNGVSVNAVKNGLSYDTSMGFTPLEGAIMGTRAGDHDAALDFYVMQKENYSPKEIDTILNKKSGLLGITGKYIDRRDVIKAAEKGEERAKLAIEMEVYRLKKYIGAYTAVLGRLDALIFTAGVGEMSNVIRAKVLDGLETLGIKYDPEKNKLARTRNKESDISAFDSKIKIFVIPTDEELVFVEDVVALIEGTYDIHTNFRYTFQERDYKNLMREKAYKKEQEKYS
ncbi:MAG: acetate kinase [Atribacterota bacterium]|nr:acetate kinase [Atribacterota bacterium]MDD4895557.1 acetate kinase [Atribacterota bacterium]MDD5636494.1 acetate kinase [Atribacterota bacterium]